MKKLLLYCSTLFYTLTTFSQTIQQKIDAASDKVESKMIAWRRDLHEHPELGNRETRTAKIIADHLRSLGIEVKEGVAKEDAEKMKKQLEAAGAKVTLK